MVNRPELNPDPLATNRGVSSKVSLSIDWVSCTFKDSKKLSYPPELTKEKVECRPFNGYNLAARYSDGRIEMVHTTRKEMGTHIVVSGSALKQLPIETFTLLMHLVGSGGTITRLDIAVDCVNCNLKPSDATEEIKNGRVRTLARQFPVWFDPSQKGHTQYVGKKTSSAFCRIYDKAAEMGSDEEWTRVECVFSGKRAMDAAQKCLRGEDYRGLVRGFVDFDSWPEWRQVMQAKAVRTVYARPISATKRWLLSAAAPSMARELYLDGDDEFYFKWLDNMRFFLDKLRQNMDESETG